MVTRQEFSPSNSVDHCHLSFHRCSIFIHLSSGGWTLCH